MDAWENVLAILGGSQTEEQELDSAAAQDIWEKY